MARPSKLTPEVSEKIVRAIRAGNYPAVAAAHAGIHAATYYRWMEHGELEGEAGEDDPYRARGSSLGEGRRPSFRRRPPAGRARRGPSRASSRSACTSVATPTPRT